MPDGNGCITPPKHLAIATNQALTPLLAFAVQFTWQSVTDDQVRDIPQSVRSSLESHFTESELASVRWTLADKVDGLFPFVVGEGTRYKAVTLGGLIVFEDRAASQDIGLWAHELQHVRQYRKAGGLNAFARDYLARWPELEQDAVAETNEILADLDAGVKQGIPTARRCGTTAGA